MKTISKKQITYIDASKIEALLTGLKFGYIILPNDAPLPEGHDGKRVARVQAGFIKVPGERGRAIYIAKTKRVGRIDVSGFVSPTKGLVNLGDSKFGAVEQQLNVGLPEEEIMENLENLLDHMLTLEARVTVKETKKAKEASDQAVGWSFQPTQTEEQKAAAKKARKDLIDRVAAEKGVTVSAAEVA